jgi:hypothetical protein
LNFLKIFKNRRNKSKKNHHFGPIHFFKEFKKKNILKGSEILIFFGQNFSLFWKKNDKNLLLKLSKIFFVLCSQSSSKRKNEKYSKNQIHIAFCFLELEVFKFFVTFLNCKILNKPLFFKFLNIFPKFLSLFKILKI